MKLSKREAVLLILLLIVALGFMEYMLVYVPGLARFDALTEKNQKVLAQVNEINRLIDSTPSIKTSKEKTLSEIATVAKPFYDQLSTDALLLNTHELLTKSGLKLISYATTDLNVSLIQTEKSQLADLSYQLKKLANDYANAATIIDKPTVTPTPTPIPKTDKTDDKLGAVEIYTIEITTSGSYDQIKQFITSIESLNKSITVTSLVIGSTEVPGTIDVRISINYYGVKKIITEKDPSNTWPNPDYLGGTGDPFSDSIIVPSPTPTSSAKVTTPTTSTKTTTPTTTVKKTN
jgi:Tfp pilus assembly protein PilO